MGQAEIKDILEQSKEWLLSREIAELANLSIGSVQASLARMIKFKEVQVKPAKEVITDKARIKSVYPGYAYRLSPDF